MRAVAIQLSWGCVCDFDGRFEMACFAWVLRGCGLAGFGVGFDVDGGYCCGVWCVWLFVVSVYFALVVRLRFWWFGFGGVVDLL